MSLLLPSHSNVSKLLDARYPLVLHALPEDVGWERSKGSVVCEQDEFVLTGQGTAVWHREPINVETGNVTQS